MLCNFRCNEKGKILSDMNVLFNKEKYMALGRRTGSLSCQQKRLTKYQKNFVSYLLQNSLLPRIKKQTLPSLNNKNIDIAVGIQIAFKPSRANESTSYLTTCTKVDIMVKLLFKKAQFKNINLVHSPTALKSHDSLLCSGCCLVKQRARNLKDIVPTQGLSQIKPHKGHTLEQVFFLRTRYTPQRYTYIIFVNSHLHLTHVGFSPLYPQKQ